jgi:alpha-mannosidase
MDYAILPHTGRWDQAGIWTAATRYNEPLLVKEASAGRSMQAPPVKKPSARQSPPIYRPSAGLPAHSLLRLSRPGWEIPSVTMSGADVLVRLFNAEGQDSLQRIYPGFPVKNASLIRLDGKLLQRLDIKKDSRGEPFVVVTAPRFGIRTIQFNNLIK